MAAKFRCVACDGGGVSHSMVRLQLDVGNTRLKWRLLSLEADEKGAQVLGRGFCVRADFETEAALLASVVESLGRLDVGAAVAELQVSTVAEESLSVAIRDWARQVWGVEACFAYVTRSAAGVSVGYDNPDLLGVDRWLAVLGASRYGCEGVIVVDCGSAVTVDVLSGSRHRGGYIVPGLRLMNAALFGDTARVKVVADWLDSGEPGSNTSAAVNSGLPLMVVGLVREVWRRQLQDGGRWTVLLTGGDAPLLSSMLGDDPVCQVVEDLVLDGLLLADVRPLG
ncbi:type III pantothenate kinase [Aestuariicella sp. G3-2]|uniref:type III pantothenate kinase n=1 Tax=Pseudomaricurvus albidus TaxID=2842452 RepID=UPI001C0B3A63|nr:type III pantothenate kinase [Aestuariicella albida]MBU3068202.1 type III pantothenate kinase [Aestuariicella albida]